ncbi:hypothetical protein Taro_003556 [Colocasia esculenta]|uniref:Uncharacterized protein n=1 Tax=Colocasia esculenta TaxID=4460 RepID=A0A843TS87_COLES|nr:hypothetical protein [Colocasia esculenta]
MASRGGSHSVALCPVWHLVPALSAGQGSDTICDDPTSKLAQQPCQLVDFPRSEVLVADHI